MTFEGYRGGKPAKDMGPPSKAECLGVYCDQDEPCRCKPESKVFQGPYTLNLFRSVAELFGLDPDDVIEIRLWDGKLRIEARHLKPNEQGSLELAYRSSQTFYIQKDGESFDHG